MQTPAITEMYNRGLTHFKTLELKELRRRQSICEDEIKKAYAQEAPSMVWQHLQIKQTALDEAVDYVAFEKPKKIRR